MTRWLTVVGIGEDGAAGLTPAARDAIAAAPIVFGGARHLALAAALIRGEPHPWPTPFAAGLEAVIARRGTPVCVLASGDPMFHGVGATLARHVLADEMRVLPAPSSPSLAAARLGWPLAEVEIVSLHARPVEMLRPFVHPGRRLLVLTSDADGPRQIAAWLTLHGFGASRLWVLEALGGPHERVRISTAAEGAGAEIHPLNLVALHLAADASAATIPLTPGLDDDLFVHDGQITKSDVRALTLGALAPRRGELLWDIGAGSGSVAIEWLLRDPSLQAIAIEARADRATTIQDNARQLGVPRLRLIEGLAPDALAGLPTPDAVFVGGGASAETLAVARHALRSCGRLVVNAVTLETEALLIAAHAEAGGRLLRLALSRATAIGGRTGWRPAMPITQWAWIKP